MDMGRIKLVKKPRLRTNEKEGKSDEIGIAHEGKTTQNKKLKKKKKKLN